MAITQKRTPNYLEAPLLLFILNLFLFSSLFPFSVFLPLLSFWIQFSSDNIWSDTTWECLRAAVLLNKPISHPFLFCSHCYEKLIQIPSASFLFGYQRLFVFRDFLKCTHTYPLQILVILFSDLTTTGVPAVLSVAHCSPAPLPWKKKNLHKVLKAQVHLFA